MAKPPTKRTTSLELRSVRAGLHESPPPAPSGTTIREWFAGLALMNPELMRGLEPNERALEATRLADELIAALAAPRVPATVSLAPPSDAEMAEWDRCIEARKVRDERRERDTFRERGNVGTGDIRPGCSLLPPPPPAVTHFRHVSDMLRQASPGRYSVIEEPESEHCQEKP
jgi:hypothetical protein